MCVHHVFSINPACGVHTCGGVILNKYACFILALSSRYNLYTWWTYCRHIFGETIRLMLDSHLFCLQYIYIGNICDNARLIQNVSCIIMLDFRQNLSSMGVSCIQCMRGKSIFDLSTLWLRYMQHEWRRYMVDTLFQRLTSAHHKSARFSGFCPQWEHC